MPEVWVTANTAMVGAKISRFQDTETYARSLDHSPCVLFASERPWRPSLRATSKVQLRAPPCASPLPSPASSSSCRPTAARRTQSLSTSATCAGSPLHLLRGQAPVPPHRLKAVVEQMGSSQTDLHGVESRKASLWCSPRPGRKTALVGCGRTKGIDSG